jgi:hypothetical protein
MSKKMIEVSGVGGQCAASGGAVHFKGKRFDQSPVYSGILMKNGLTPQEPIQSLNFGMAYKK